MKLASRDYVFSFRMMEGEGGHSYPYRLRLRKHCELLMSSLTRHSADYKTFFGLQIGQILRKLWLFMWNKSWMSWRVGCRISIFWVRGRALCLWRKAGKALKSSGKPEKGKKIGEYRKREVCRKMAFLMGQKLGNTGKEKCAGKWHLWWKTRKLKNIWGKRKTTQRQWNVAESRKTG